MDLLLMILRFLFGMPLAAAELDPIAVHVDGQSGGRRRIATRHSIQDIMGATTIRQRIQHSKFGSPSCLECLSYQLGKEPRSRSRCQDNGRRSRI